MAMKVQELVPVEFKEQRVLTTKQIAELYCCSVDAIKHNFRRAKKYFIEGVHYFKVEGEELKRLKEEVAEGNLFHSQGVYQSPVAGATLSLILYTKQGAARHCKMVNTKEAWNVFNEMEQFYFEKNAQPVPEPCADVRELVDRIDKLEEEVIGLKATLEMWLTEMQKKLSPAERAERLMSLALLLPPSDTRQRIFAEAANALVGKNIF